MNNQEEINFLRLDKVKQKQDAFVNLKEDDSIYFVDSNQKEMLRFESSGGTYHRGKLIGSDKELFEAVRNFFITGTVTYD